MSGSFSMSRRIGMILLLLAICQELCYSEILRFDPNLDGGSIVHIIRKRSPDEPSSPPSFPSDNSTASDPSTDVLPPRHIDDVKYESSDSLSPTESPKPVVSSSSSIPSANAPVSQSSPGTSTTTTSAIPPDEQTFPPLLPNSGSGDDDLDDDEILELDAIKTAIMDILKGLGNDSDPFSEAKPDPELRDPEEDKEHDQWKSLMEKLKNQGYIRENEIINATAVWDEKDRTNVSIKNDHHMYYNTTIYPDGSHFWVNLSTMQNLRHEVLSESHRRASFVSLPFKFPYYGHYLNNVTIATGGFLYTGAYIHSWLAVTQYIAPLMANFDPSASKDSSINYGSNETTFTVEWTNVTNPDHPDSPPFTFQVSLHKNGDIVFAYKDVPLSAALLRQDSHPVKVGIADAYTIERTVFFIRKKTIFEYHKVDLKDEMFGNSSAIYFKALPTCLMFNDCASCAASEGVKFECSWCEQVKRCSDGVDRFRQDWIFNGCVKTSVSKVEKCDALKGLPIGDGSGTYNIPDPGEDSAFGNRRGWKNKDSSSEEDGDDDNKISRSESFDVKKQTATNEASMAHSGTSGLLTVFFISVAVILLAGWVFYAYRNPQTPSGQFLIRYRPSRLFHRDNVRYSAASIHM